MCCVDRLNPHRSGATIAGGGAAVAVGFKAFVGGDASLASGEDRTTPNIGRGRPGSNAYQPTADGLIPAEFLNVNAIGKNEVLTSDMNFFSQGGSLSVALNKIPGMNAVSQFHDTIFNRNLLNFNAFNNVVTMIPAAAVSYAANISHYSSAICRNCREK